MQRAPAWLCRWHTRRSAAASAPGAWIVIAGIVTIGAAPEADAPPVAPPTSTVKVNCRVVPVEREFQRPIAYDVDYIYKGVKYRSRLAEDPGNRLRIRISVVPYVAPAQATASGP